MSLCGTVWTIELGDNRAEIAEVGAGLRSYTYKGLDITCSYGGNELPPKACGTTLVPWTNRIRDGRYTFDGIEQQLALTEPDKGNAIHGLGRWARWSMLEQTGNSVRLGLDVVPQKGYPFELHAEVRYHFLDTWPGLMVQLSATNTGTVRAPFGMGSHPYLSTRGAPINDTFFAVPARKTFDVDEQQIPVRTRALRKEEKLPNPTLLGKRRFDMGLTGIKFEDGFAEVELKSLTGAEARMWFEKEFGYLQVYTVNEVTPGQPGIAVEPMTCAPNAFNSGDGLIVLEPFEEWTGKWGIIPPIYR